ncbi:asparagine synthetase B family protein [Parahaliea aestuarii]|uniref:asparagine synthase (glutamine-hydrolyzing) n=1 Tax=Parahaliea aestuarii TaxID=1852021 RepID=A0A5C8ZPK3_9GAMM|nr:asparagine synthase-related protein [Parahaliea aestuarii]TXS89640.1 asparagine synthase [Parahaliea aestuarii]
MGISGDQSPAGAEVPGFLAALHSAGQAFGEHQLNNGNWQTATAGTKASAFAPQPVFLSPDGQVLVVAQGRFLWPAGEFADTASSLGNGAALYSTYREYGADMARHIKGHFAFALVDSARDTLIAATDRFATVPIYHTCRDGDIAVATRLADLQPPLGDDPLNRQALFDYCYFHFVPSPTSIATGVGKLPAAHALVSARGDVRIAPYWLPDFSAKAHATAPAEREATLRRLLGTAVQRSCKDARRPAAFLSGGLDSSTVAGFLAEQQNGASAYCIGFDAEGYDETPFARITASHFGLQLREYYLSPEDIVAALPELAASTQEPFGNSSILPAYFCARLAAEEGVDLMLAGDGGDELFAGNERYLRQRVFTPYQRLPGGLRRGLLEPMAKRLPGRFSATRKIASYVEQAATPLPDRLQSYNFLHRFQPTQMFQPGFLDAVDLSRPLNLLRELYHRPAAGTELDRLLYHDWQVTLADNDLRKVGHACQLAGVQVAYPLLDTDLADFSIGIPDAVLLQNGSLRGFYKKALRGWLPDATLNKSKHGFGLPFGVWMRDHKPLQELVYGSISRLAERDIFRPEFLSRSVALHREGHAAYYGELLWVLTCLELWLGARPDGDEVN